MTTVTMAVSPNGIGETFSIIVSQAVQHIQTAVVVSRRQIQSAVLVVTKSPQITGRAKAEDTRKLTAVETLWRYRSAGVIGITAIGLIAPLVHPGPVTGVIFPFGLWLWWLRYRELERAHS